MKHDDADDLTVTFAYGRDGKTWNAYATVGVEARFHCMVPVGRGSGFNKRVASTRALESLLAAIRRRDEQRRAPTRP